MVVGWAAGYRERCQLASSFPEHYEYLHLNLLQDHPPSTKIGIRIAKYPQQILSLNLIKRTLHIIMRAQMILKLPEQSKRLKYLHRKSLWNCLECALVTIAGIMLTWSAEAHAWHRILGFEACPRTTEYIQAALKFVSGGWQYIMPLGSDQKHYCGWNPPPEIWRSRQSRESRIAFDDTTNVSITRLPYWTMVYWLQEAQTCGSIHHLECCIYQTYVIVPVGMARFIYSTW